MKNPGRCECGNGNRWEPVSDEAVEADIVPKKTKTLKVKKDSENDPKQVTVEEMREMTVSTLRSLARQLKIDTMSSRKYASPRNRN